MIGGSGLAYKEGTMGVKMIKRREWMCVDDRRR
jgi:hypothetical protein